MGSGRRIVLAGLASTVFAAKARAKIWRVAFANADETPGARLEGLGFTGADVRRSFELAARTLPLEMVWFDNAGDDARAIANAHEATRRGVDLLIEFNPETSVNTEIAEHMKAAGIPVIAVAHPVGDAPLYTPDNRAAGALAGQALGVFSRNDWPDEAPIAAVVGDLGDPTAAIADRIKGIHLGFFEQLPMVTPTLLDTGGQSQRAESIVAKYLREMPRRKVLIAALDDPTALSARIGVEVAIRQHDCVIISQGLDRSIHGGASEKKEIDPANRASVILGSVAYYLDRYGYEVLPLVLRILNGEPVPPRTVTNHILVTARNVFREYPPTDMN